MQSYTIKYVPCLIIKITCYFRSLHHANQFYMYHSCDYRKYTCLFTVDKRNNCTMFCYPLQFDMYYVLQLPKLVAFICCELICLKLGIIQNFQEVENLQVGSLLNIYIISSTYIPRKKIYNHSHAMRSSMYFYIFFVGFGFFNSKNHRHSQRQTVTVR